MRPLFIVPPVPQKCLVLPLQPKYILLQGNNFQSVNTIFQTDSVHIWQADARSMHKIQKTRTSTKRMAHYL